MVSVFTREITDNLASLVKKLDQQVGNPSDTGNPNRAFVVLLSDNPEADAAKLEAFAKKHGIKNIPLTIFKGRDGPPPYHIAKDAAVTVVMWSRQKVKASCGFKQGELTPEAVAKVLADAKKNVFTTTSG